MVRLSLTFNKDDVIALLVGKCAEELELECSWKTDNDLLFTSELTDEQLSLFSEKLFEFGISVGKSTENDLVSRIKSILTASVYSEKFRSRKISVLLSDELEYNYAHLSHVFSQATYTTIENFLILIKIERVKDLMLLEGTSLTQIAHQLDYSSVSHLSAQFKRTTGLTVTQFLKLKSLNNN